MTGRTALLWMTHMWNPELEAEFERILTVSYPGSPEVWLILDSSTPGAYGLARRYERCHVFNVNELFDHLPYQPIGGGTLYFHVHFPILDFFLSHPEYDYYWVIEFDVRYTGEWESFLHLFESFHQDLITCHIRYFSQEPFWYWWKTFRHPTKSIDQNKYLRSFNVIFRISNRALAVIHEEQRDGWQGHPEVLIPTLLVNRGYTLLDFGGDGEFVMPSLRNTFYTSGSTKDGVPNPFCTVRWRPSGSRVGIRKNKIYHPVKPESGLEPLKERLLFFTRWTRHYLSEKLAGHR
jgi:hypothetical protein